ncbi:MAG TPA: hypothetical protein VE029_06690 [Rhizobacter sp.]|nr:hypothetical protein [Rhizobacter sp.]
MNTSTMDLTDMYATRHGFGLPEDRLARVAARRAFVEMKLCFIRAAAAIEGSLGAQLQRKVRLSTEVTDLWRLRTALFDALPRDVARANQYREEMRQQLDSAFPEQGEDTGFAPLRSA